MHKKWVVAAKKADFNAIAAQFNISPYLARIIRNRDVIGDEAINMYLNAGLSDMHSPALLRDIDIASDILFDACTSGTKIRIVGDYDIDGVCASLILKKGIEYMGGDVDVRLPDRIHDGYGINEEIIREAYDAGVELIITCDNGISAAHEIQMAMELGISVIVTDHHEVPYEEIDGNKKYIIPPADAVVDPKRPDCTYPFSGICGAMVAYKLILNIFNNTEYDFAFDNAENCNVDDLKNELLSFAAFATIGDVMELVDENRVAVKEGLKILRNTKNVGLKALMEVTGLDPKSIDVYHIGFILGPCVNAVGRLESAVKALELFSETDRQRAVVVAEELRSFNENRKNMTVQSAKQAIELARNRYSNDKVLVIYLPDCFESIAGIVAGKVREEFYKPTIILTNDADGNLKGSGRSIEAYSMFEELSKVKELFTKYGGHKLAAGLSMPAGLADELRKRLNENCTLKDEELVEKMVIDIPMPIGYISEAFIKEMEKLAPFGNANPKPLFAQKDVEVLKIALVGKNQNVCKLRLAGTNASGEKVMMDGVIYGDAPKAFEDISGQTKISVLYQATINEYMGNRSVSLVIKDYSIS